jgi:hypothetical protein
MWSEVCGRTWIEDPDFKKPQLYCAIMNIKNINKLNLEAGNTKHRAY